MYVEYSNDIFFFYEFYERNQLFKLFLIKKNIFFSNDNIWFVEKKKWCVKLKIKSNKYPTPGQETWLVIDSFLFLQICEADCDHIISHHNTVRFQELWWEYINLF
jgi:hypothetical protein